jgi:hypothetical protein
VLYWDRNGFCLWQKRLERHRFCWPRTAQDFMTIEGKQWEWLLAGLPERGFRCLKDVLEMRSIYHKSEQRVRAHISVAALALLLTRVLERRLTEDRVDLSTEQVMQALSTIRLVGFKVGAS